MTFFKSAFSNYYESEYNIITLGDLEEYNYIASYTESTNLLYEAKYVLGLLKESSKFYKDDSLRSEILNNALDAEGKQLLNNICFFMNVYRGKDYHENIKAYVEGLLNIACKVNSEAKYVKDAYVKDQSRVIPLRVIENEDGERVEFFEFDEDVVFNDNERVQDERNPKKIRK